MRYADARPMIRSGDLLAWSHIGWGSIHALELQAIRIFTRSEYVHVGVALEHYGRVLVIEATVPEVRISVLSNKLPVHWFGGGLRDPWDDAVETRAMEIVGAPYSKWEAIKGFLGKAKASNGYWQCAEAAAYIRSPLLGAEPAFPTPTHVASHALALGATHQLLTK